MVDLADEGRTLLDLARDADAAGRPAGFTPIPPGRTAQDESGMNGSRTTMETTKNTSRRYYEDLRVGQKFQTPSYEMTAEAIKAFAAQFDPQPFHMDDAAAQSSLFKGLAASGWHTAAVVMRLLVESDLKLAGGTIGGGVSELRWPRPVRPGDVLRVEGEVIEMRRSRTRPELGIVTVRLMALNQAGEPVQISTPALMVPTRDPSAS